MKTLAVLGSAAVLLIGNTVRAAPAGLTAEEIVRRSVVNSDRNWKAAPQYTYVERDIDSKGGKKTDRTYQDLMIDGSPYQKLVAVNGRKLTGAMAEREDLKLKQTTARRAHESASDRAKRIARYQRERRQDHELMQQMTKALEFKLAGNETVDGRQCYVLDGVPRPGYRPINRDTEVLTGMRGRLWIDVNQLQWVKVRAEVFRPVAFGLFVAKVEPGTAFTLEQKPIGDGVWMPSQFGQAVKVKMLHLWSRNSTERVTYSDYRRGEVQQAQTSN